MYALKPWSVREFPDVTVLSGARVSASQGEYVARAVGRVLAHHEIAGGARVRLKTGPCGRGPMVVQVNLRVGEFPARVHAVTSGLDDLTPALLRLDRHIVRMYEQWRPRPWPDPTRRLMTIAGDAVVVRRKSVVVQCSTPLEAVAVMDAMDYDAHLFTDVETGEDAVVYRAGPSGLRLARQRHVYPPGWASSSSYSGLTVPLIVNSRQTICLTEEAAVRRAHQHRPNLLFFTESATGRGNLLYPRYDGNLGLITPLPRV
ncbi:sigma 54 modulation/S30EA ribosomal C-terminal domain-containing protein [Mycobacterium attenuatum]|uniref:sigma 54 modulation/S30EA ribosomal C-terminal domain-containing protein n=1 Tax=Mycobacterium attenuatum TaxID=2341086 RepID=UPI001FCECFFD|nr:sigma 54 modulation/S30EA ribosomal C-terminal domain-containing protein [Mycobacterium attenuatum]